MQEDETVLKYLNAVVSNANDNITGGLDKSLHGITNAIGELGRGNFNVIDSFNDGRDAAYKNSDELRKDYPRTNAYMDDAFMGAGASGLMQLGSMIKRGAHKLSTSPSDIEVKALKAQKYDASRKIEGGEYILDTAEELKKINKMISRTDLPISNTRKMPGFIKQEQVQHNQHAPDDVSALIAKDDITDIDPDGIWAKLKDPDIGLEYKIDPRESANIHNLQKNDEYELARQYPDMVQPPQYPDATNLNASNHNIQDMFDPNTDEVMNYLNRASRTQKDAMDPRANRINELAQEKDTYNMARSYPSEVQPPQYPDARHLKDNTGITDVLSPEEVAKFLDSINKKQ